MLDNFLRRASRCRFRVLFGNFAESQLKDFKETIEEEETAEDYGYLSDSDLEDEDGETTSLKRPSQSNVVKPDLTPLACEEQEECVEKGKVVRIPDIAFVTSVQEGCPLNFSLTPLQVPSFPVVPLCRCDRVRTVRFGRKSQVMMGRYCRPL